MFRLHASLACPDTVLTCQQLWTCRQVRLVRVPGARGLLNLVMSAVRESQAPLWYQKLHQAAARFPRRHINAVKS
jgi:hypothetical protein